MCDSDNVITDPDVCMMVNDTKNKLHLIKPCESEDKPICNFANINYTNPAKCEAAPPAELTYPGESCTKNSQCHSGLCVNGVCKGKGFNETCTDDYDCDAGYYCSDWDKKCKEQRQFGEVRNFDILVKYRTVHEILIVQTTVCAIVEYVFTITPLIISWPLIIQV